MFEIAFKREACALISFDGEVRFDPQKGLVVLTVLKEDRFRGLASCWRIFDHRPATMEAVKGQKKGAVNPGLLVVIQKPAWVVVTERGIRFLEPKGVPATCLFSFQTVDTSGWPNPRPVKDSAIWRDWREYRRPDRSRAMNLLALTGPGQDLVFYLPTGEHQKEPYLHLNEIGYWSKTREEESLVSALPSGDDMIWA